MYNFTKEIDGKLIELVFDPDTLEVKQVETESTKDIFTPKKIPVVATINSIIARNLKFLEESEAILEVEELLMLDELKESYLDIVDED